MPLVSPALPSLPGSVDVSAIGCLTLEHLLHVFPVEMIVKGSLDDEHFPIGQQRGWSDMGHVPLHANKSDGGYPSDGVPLSATGGASQAGANAARFLRDYLLHL